MKDKAGIPFIAVGAAFLGVGATGRHTFLGVGAAFLAIGIAFLVRQRRSGGSDR